MANRKRHDRTVYLLTREEAAAMVILWNAEEALTANEVVHGCFEAATLSGQPLPNYTTIASMLNRLVQRELLTATKHTPRHIVYAPATSREAYAAAAASEIADMVELDLPGRDRMAETIQAK